MPGARIVKNPYQPGKETQQWERRCNQIANRIYTNVVLDIPSK